MVAVAQFDRIVSLLRPDVWAGGFVFCAHGFSAREGAPSQVSESGQSQGKVRQKSGGGLGVEA